LDAAAALVQGVAGQPDHMKWVHYRHCVRELFCGSSFKSGEPVHRDDLHAVPPRLLPGGEPPSERGLAATLDHVQQPGRSGAVPHRGEVDDHGDVLVAAAGVAPDVLIDAEDLNPVEPVGVIDQDTATLDQHRAVGGVPRNAKGSGDPGHRQVPHHEAFQRPPQTATGQPGPRFGGAAGVLPPHPTTIPAPVPADRDQQQRRPPPQRLVGKHPGHRIPRYTTASASNALIARVDDPTGDDRPVRFQELARREQAELVEPAERGQIRVGESRVGHVEVLRMYGVGTFILEGPRHPPRQRRAARLHPHL
jgi:hypothetical protein